MKRLLLLTLALAMLLVFANDSYAQPIEQQSMEVAASANESDVQLFPNPIQDQLNVVSKTKVIVRLEIFNLKGEVVFTSGMEVPEGARLSINTSDYAKGFYVVKIIFKNVAQPQMFRIYKN
ncbi:MAG: T9SS type A sorting domain-containing protein [Prevotellaceae bacterium]|nr:T9SS type A sorting domain-containing protein [Prevotellaceae bacterium]